MGRKTVFEDVVDMPWPVGVVAAAISYVVFQLFLAKSPDGQLGATVGSVVSMIGWFFTGMFLLAAFFSFLRQILRGKRFKTTRSIADIRSLHWRQFERFIGEHFRKSGYFVVETPEGPDNGVDLILRKDGEKTYVQCKQWKTNHVSVEKIRELLGSMAAGGAHGGIFVTSGTYTQPAVELARQSGIKLIDGNELVRLRGQIAGEPITFESADHSSTIKCPRCDSPMVKRVAKKGQNQGLPFWGCSTFPECRGIRKLRV